MEEGVEGNNLLTLISDLTVGPAPRLQRSIHGRRSALAGTGKGLMLLFAFSWKKTLLKSVEMVHNLLEQ